MVYTSDHTLLNICKNEKRKTNAGCLILVKGVKRELCNTSESVANLFSTKEDDESVIM